MAMKSIITTGARGHWVQFELYDADNVRIYNHSILSSSKAKRQVARADFEALLAEYRELGVEIEEVTKQL